MNNTPLSEEKDEATFGDHLEVFRKHIMRAVIVVVLMTIIAFSFKTFVFDSFILYPKSPDFISNKIFCKLGELLSVNALCVKEHSYELINIKITGQFMVHIMVSLTLGFIAAFPYVMWELWRFIKPALSKKEQKYSRGIVFYTGALFATGVAFGYFVITPLALNFFSTYEVSSQLGNQFVIQSYISTLTTSCVSTGIAFELPIIIYFLSKIGFTTPRGLKKYRKHAIVVLLIVAAILTPADPFSMILVAIPLLFLYEFSIGISKRVEKKRELQL